MKQFNGEIAGAKLKDFDLAKLKAVGTYKERKALVDELITKDGHVHEFFTTYFNEYYDSTPSQEGFLSEDTAVAKFLEIIGTYLLSASDIESERKIEYKFWKSERDFKKSKENDNINTSALEGGDNNNREVIDMFVDPKDDKNQKIVRAMTVNSKDTKEIEEIGLLQDAIDYIKSEKGIKDTQNRAKAMLEQGLDNEFDRARVKYIANNTERYVSLYAKDLKENQLVIKKAILRPIEFKAILKGEGAMDKLDALDFMEKDDILHLMDFMATNDLMSDIGILTYDLQQLLKSTKLSDRELEIIKLLKLGMKKSEIAETLEIRKQNVTTYMKRISEKASKTYEKQVESYRDFILQKKVN